MHTAYYSYDTTAAAAGPQGVHDSDSGPIDYLRAEGDQEEDHHRLQIAGPLVVEGARHDSYANDAEVAQRLRTC